MLSQSISRHSRTRAARLFIERWPTTPSHGVTQLSSISTDAPARVPLVLSDRYFGTSPVSQSRHRIMLSERPTPLSTHIPSSLSQDSVSLITLSIRSFSSNPAGSSSIPPGTDQEIAREAMKKVLQVPEGFHTKPRETLPKMPEDDENTLTIYAMPPEIKKL